MTLGELKKELNNLGADDKEIKIDLSGKGLHIIVDIVSIGTYSDGSYHIEVE